MLADPLVLERDLVDSRARAIRVTGDLHGEQLLGPKLAIVNPPLWEIGHVSWFQEYWCLRMRPDGSLAETLLPGADALYDSSAVAHDTRWDLPLPDLAATRAYGEQVLERVRERLAREPESESLQYLARLATFHEDMHAEAFLYTRQTLGYANPGFDSNAPALFKGEVDIAGGTFVLGAGREQPFVFDNEKWAHEVTVAPFRISRAPVLNGDFLAYVESGGAAPRYWRKEGSQWLERRFDGWRRLDRNAPVRHVSWEEAQAWCAWAGRRLPTETEWEHACAHLEYGELWEWTASDFTPYPGFAADPYKDYSRPWFGSHKVLRGASFFTPARLRWPTFRNFYMPGRGDVFCGFRSCALG